MKSVLAFVAAMTLGQLSQAKTVCTIVTGNPSKMTFDRVLFQGEISSSTLFMVGENGVEVFNTKDIDTVAKWKKLNGRSLVALAPGQVGTFAISVSHVDMRKTQNVLPIDAMAVSKVAEGQFLNLIEPSRNLSINCQGTN